MICTKEEEREMFIYFISTLRGVLGKL